MRFETAQSWAPLVGAVALSLVATTAQAQSVEENICHWKKLQKIHKHGKCMLDQYSGAYKKSEAVDPARLAKCGAKTANQYAALEKKGGEDCPLGNGDLAPMQAAVDAGVGNAVALLPGGSAGEGDIRCESAKIKLLGQYCNCYGRSAANAFRENNAPDFTKCEAKLTQKWLKTDEKYGTDCPAGTGAIGPLRDTMIDKGEALDNLFNPPPTTVPNTTTTTIGGGGGSTTTTLGGGGGNTTTTLDPGGTTTTTTTTSTSTTTTTLGLQDSIVFVTSTTSDGDLGGIAGADATCNSLASAAGLPGTYMAWLSTGTANPDGRMFKSTNPYRTPDNVLLATNWNKLTQGFLQNPPNLDESGTAVGNVPVWTGTAFDGTRKAPDCSGWTNSAGTGWAGESWRQHSHWTQWQERNCTEVKAFYCVQQLQ